MELIINESFDKILEKLRESNPALLENIKALKRKNSVYSDVISYNKNQEKLQWINFVQEGGGTLGISLVGYAFVLEYLGIRFLRLAGTSAGAINTLFLASIGNKHQPKTPELFDMMTDSDRFDMRSFVDTRYPIVRKLIFSLSKGAGIIKNIFSSYIVLLILALFILPILSIIGRELSIIYVVAFCLFVGITGYGIFLLMRFSKYNFGINPGKKFEDFLKDELERYGIKNQKQLDIKAKFSFSLQKVNFIEPDSEHEITNKNNTKLLYLNMTDRKEQDLKYENAEESGSNLKEFSKETKPLTEISCDYSFISTDIKNEQKIVFPVEADLYFENPETQNPAEYVRASMAIPIFFEPKNIKIPDTTAIKAKWSTKKGLDHVKDSGILIDGGSLSNFPINIFHQSHIKEPRIPIMGVRISDEPSSKNLNYSKRLSFFSYLNMIINTLRSNEDNSFLAINPFYKKYCIADIKAYETKVNWLNFSLTDAQKMSLFNKGVEAAIEYLINFDWESYKVARAELN